MAGWTGVTEAAQITGYTVSRLRQMLRSGQLKGKQVATPYGPYDYAWLIKDKDLTWLSAKRESWGIK